MKLGSSEWMFLIFLDPLFLPSALPIFVCSMSNVLRMAVTVMNTLTTLSPRE